MDVDIEVPVWLIDIGVVPVVKWLKAENGTTVSWATLTAEPVDVLPRPEFANEFDARLRATSSATEVLDEAVAEFSIVVPATACVNCVPEGAPPAVLIYSSLRISGFCQYCGATSMTTWYCCGLKGFKMFDTCAWAKASPNALSI